MDPSILNALIFEYVSKKDKVLANTLKNKLKAVSTIWSLIELSQFGAKIDENFQSTFHDGKNAFSEIMKAATCLAFPTLDIA